MQENLRSAETRLSQFVRLFYNAYNGCLNRRPYTNFRLFVGPAPYCIQEDHRVLDLPFSPVYGRVKSSNKPNTLFRAVSCSHLPSMVLYVTPDLQC